MHFDAVVGHINMWISVFYNTGNLNQCWKDKMSVKYYKNARHLKHKENIYEENL